jgi:hypothetical protein
VTAPTHREGEEQEVRTMSASQEDVEPLRVIGRRERVSFPAWDLHRVRAKVDTGAYSSVLDVAGYELIEGEDGARVRLTIAPSKRRPDRLLCVEEPVLKMVRVRNSTGSQAMRPLIEPVVRMGPVTRRIRLTVHDRSKMRCRMLLGRQAIAGLFLVDVRAKYLLD